MARIYQSISQNMSQRLELRPKMLQSLHLLSLPILELELHLKQELVTNPLLELQDEEPEETEKIEETEAPETESEETGELAKALEDAAQLSEVLDQWNDYHGD
ncbi:MAG: RNA polymerase sigma-54 factor, partial [Candidatus Cloacimonetes bacterium]|nr:RNA polymerase sigma-54 factor [Candidatus Cloacimonadota bacterium]